MLNNFITDEKQLHNFAIVFHNSMEKYVTRHTRASCLYNLKQYSVVDKFNAYGREGFGMFAIYECACNFKLVNWERRKVKGPVKENKKEEKAKKNARQ